jgi:hypothetical protein
VAAVAGSALNFAIDYRQDLFAGVPIVFCSVDRRDYDLRRGRSERACFFPPATAKANRGISVAPRIPNLACILHLPKSTTVEIFPVAGSLLLSPLDSARSESAISREADSVHSLQCELAIRTDLIICFCAIRFEPEIVKISNFLYAGRTLLKGIRHFFQIPLFSV